MKLNECTTDKICKHLTLIYDNFTMKRSENKLLQNGQVSKYLF